MARKGNLKLVEQQDEEAKRQQQEEAWKLTPGEVAGRVREIRKYLEEFSVRLAGLQFDVLNRDCPESIDCVDVTRPYELAERLAPTIKGFYERVHDRLPDEASRDDLSEMKFCLAEIAFAIGTLAGSVFPGTASRAEIDRLERGLVWAVTSRGSEIKDD